MAFGTELQLERERRAISLASIAEVTRVPQRYLIALERDLFDQLPGGILTKGILRGYCRHVGLDENEWLDKMPGIQREEPVPALAEFAENVSRSRPRRRSGMNPRWVGVAVMVLCLSALCWGAWRYVVEPRVAPLPLIDAHTANQQQPAASATSQPAPRPTSPTN